MSATEQQSDRQGEVTQTPKQQPRILRYDQYFDLRTFAQTLRKTKPPKVKKNKPILLVRRIIDYKGRHVDTAIDIKSPALTAVLLEINRDVQGLRLTQDPPSSNPHLWFHSHAALKEKLAEQQIKDSQDVDLVAGLETALQYIQEDLGSKIADFERLVSFETITFDLLWALFAPNTHVYHHHELTEQDRILLVRIVSYRQREDDSRYVKLICDVITYDGKSTGMAKDSELEIDDFDGACKIKDLDAFPLKYHAEATAIRDHAIRRGKQFTRMVGHVYYEISGPAMREVIVEKKGKNEAERFKFNSFGRVMIDPKGFRTFEPNCTYNFKVHQHLNPAKFTDDDFAICTPIALGFCFGAKMWGGFAIDRLVDISWGQDAFCSLVLNEKQKTLVHCLVMQHKRRAETFDDVVSGKGKGLIGLLSGNPGCGKTLTAEAVAEITHRPLYAVSAGELGTAATDVDKNLTKVLELSRRWDAVLLLDEAEVFLQRRSTTDINRNALVSIFLRQLEYYQGILILTTNLIAQCDPAFESRIHFSISYPDLGFKSRKAIWAIFIEKAMGDSDSKSTISADDIDKFAKFEINGRQIKNAISNAKSIALAEDSPLSTEHISTVLDVLSDWNTAKQKLLPQ